MQNSKSLRKFILLAMLVAIGVVISPILRVHGFAPTQHFINVVCSVLLGPFYSLACATMIGLIRMSLMGISPLALTGAVFGAFLSGILYNRYKTFLSACIGEVAKINRRRNKILLSFFIMIIAPFYFTNKKDSQCFFLTVL